MADLRVLVLRAAGINREEELVHCWERAGASASLVHINALSENPAMLNDFQIVAIPGGFSYGDDIAAGQILAQRILLGLAEPLQHLVDRGGGLFGVCNGFQVLVKTGLLPGGEIGRDKVTVTYNDSAKFEARWVRLKVCTDRCAFLKPDTYLEAPVDHAEGKVVTDSDATIRQLDETGLIAVRYVDADGRTDTYPANPNGSVDGIAGLCDSTGRVFGLMPHLEDHFDHTHHPLWTSRKPTGPPDGLTIFQNAVTYWS